MLTDYLNEDRLEHACTFCLRMHATLSPSDQSERERKKDRERKKEGERGGERVRKRERERKRG